jgi:hypothetical protein
MTMINIRNSGPALSEHDLARVETVTGRPLPKAYREFLLVHNGGRPVADSIDMPETPFKSTVLHTFYGIHSGNDSNDLLDNLESLEGYKENQLLPVAYDACARDFVLVLSEDRYGQVYYFELTGETPIPYFVANDFNEFLGKLREPTPEELAEIDAATSSSDEPAPNDASSSP